MPGREGKDSATLESYSRSLNVGRLKATLTGSARDRGNVDEIAAALEEGEDTVEKAIRATGEIIAKAERSAEAKRDAAWRPSFKPRAYLVSTQDHPSSITMYSFPGGADRWLKIPLELSRPPVTYAAQAHDAMAAHGAKRKRKNACVAAVMWGRADSLKKRTRDAGCRVARRNFTPGRSQNRA